jgi:integrase/recombinase XerD
MLGLLGLRIFEATSADIGDLGEEHGHRAIDQATSDRVRGPILLNRRGARMDRHAATRRLHRLAGTAGIQVTRAHPHMLRHTMSRPCSTLASTSGTSRSPPATPTRAPR